MSSAAVLALLVLVRLLLAGAERRNSPGRLYYAGRRPANRRRSWAPIVWVFGIPAGIGVVSAVMSGAVWLAPALVPLLLAVGPWPMTRAVLIPLGLPRAAYYVAQLSDVTWRLDRPGGAALAAAWALCRGGRRDDGVAAWIEQQLQRGGGADLTGEGAPQAALRGAGICAAAMLAAHRGDLAGARALFESVAMMDPGACPPEARCIASGWLAAEAASRGEWKAVAERGASGIGAGRDAWLLSGIAMRLLGEPLAPSDAELWLRWAIAPRRRATLPLVRRALAARPGAARPAPTEPEVRAARVPEGDLVGRAVLLHAQALLRRGALTGDDLRRLGGAWDAVFEDERAQADLRERALSIGASAPHAALAPVRRAVESDLAAIALEARIPRGEWEDLGETIGRATRLLRDDLLSDIELACDALRRRVDDRRELPAADEWREFLSLRDRYERASEIVGMDLRRLAFPKVHSDVCHLAVWIFNTRKERPLGNAMFRWLLSEAEALDDARAIELQRKNVDCGI